MDFHSIWDNLEKHKQNDFLVTPAYQLSNADLTNLVSRMATLFDEHKIVSGSRVLILTHNEGAAIVGFIAALLDGLVPVMLTQDTPTRRIDSIVDSTEPALVIIDEARRDEDWLKQIPTHIVVQAHVETKHKRLFGFARKHSATQRCGLSLSKDTRKPHLPKINDDLAYLLFTSGTTQEPSGVMISRKNIIANLQTISKLFDCNPNTRLFNDMALAHADGLVQGPLLAIANAATLIRSGGVSINNLENWLNRVRKQRASHFITVPTVWSFIDTYAVHDDYFDSSECTHLISGAAKFEKELWQRLQDRFSKSISNQYGLTETVVCALYSGACHPQMGGFGTIGKPIDCEARIESINDVDSQSGEMQLRGDNIFQGYWKNPKRTEETLTQDGWMKTGDLVMPCPDGSYEILGRLKSVIMSGGFLIRPEEIDEVLLVHPSIVESVTVSIPDSTFGEVPVSAVVLNDSGISENSLVEYARSNLEALKIPKRIIPLASIPRGDAGKPRLKELTKELQAILKQTVSTQEKETINDFSREVYNIAAQVLHVEPETLNADSSPTSIPSWDSFSHVALMVTIEVHFSIKIPVAKGASIRNLGELIKIVNELKK